MVATVKCDTITEASNTGTANISLDSSGNVTIGNNLTVNGTTTQTGQTLFPDGSVSAPSISNTGDTNCGIYFPAADTLGFVTSGTEDGRFDSVGNLLLNSATLSPTQTAAGSIAMTGTLAMGSSFKRNRIINGDMRVDQRNAGAATANTITGYTVDRWQVIQSVTGKVIAQQNAGSITPPVGFSNYLGVTSQSAYTVGTSDYYFIMQPIEGFNFADLAWGTLNARTITLSFQVYSSLTGTFGGSLRNSATTRSYPFSYTISSPNAWTSISITISGDTTGTWVGSTNGVGVYVSFGLGVGSTFSGTAGSWATTTGAGFISATGATSVVGTNGATFYITGVQLEVGSVATPYERQIYSEQLAQCQRYCYVPAIDSGLGNTWLMPTGYFSATTGGFASGNYPVRMRIQPTFATQTATLSNYAIYVPNGGAYLNVTVLNFNTVSSSTTALINFTVASGGTNGQGCFLTTNSIPNYSIIFSAEL